MKENNEFHKPRKALLADLQESTKALNLDKGNQYLRRQHIRLMMTTIEGYLFGLRYLAVSHEIQQKRGFLNQEEMNLAYDRIAAITDSGNVEIRETHPKFSAVFKFSFLILEKSTHSGHFIDYENVDKDGWDKLNQLEALRHKITHPKDLPDLEVADKYLEISQKTWIWFNNVYAKALFAWGYAVDDYTKSFIEDRIKLDPHNTALRVILREVEERIAKRSQKNIDDES